MIIEVDDPPRVVVLVERLEGGGAERLTVELAIFAARRGHALTVIATAERAAQPVICALKAEGVVVHALDLRGTRLWIALLRLIGRGRFDLLHSHAHLSNWRGAVVSTVARIPIFIATEHSWSYKGRPWRRLRDKHLVARRAKVLVAVSEADRKALSEVEKIPLSRLVVIPNGVQMQHDPKDVDHFLVAELMRIRSTAHPLIGTVCYLRPQKALHILIQAVALLRQELHDVELVVVGDGPLEGDLRQLVSNLGADKFIHFVGHSAAPRSLLPHIDIFALSSAFEGAPFALLDAMAEGRPIVATAVGGVPEMVPHRESSLLVDPESSDELAAALLELVRDAGLRERLAAAAANQARLFSLSASMNRWSDLYDTLWSERHSRRRAATPDQSLADRGQAAS